MNQAATIALAPLSGIYRMIVTARQALYQVGVFAVHEVGVPVISVGNLTTGGTGKTPLVEWIARELSSHGRKVCVLTRGYGRQDESKRVIASDGRELLANVVDAGDEAFMLAERLFGVAAVICDADRISSARWAIENLGIDVFVLDDAYQHQKIARTLNILTIDASNPWGNGWTLPAGTLREPKSALARADCVIITRAEAKNAEALQQKIQQMRPTTPILSSRMQFRGWRELQTNNPTTASSQIPVAAFCAIGNPDSFFSVVRSAGCQLVDTHTFRDHHSYTQRDLDELAQQAKAKGAQALVTTAKDAVKIRALDFSLPCYVAEIEMVIDQAGQLRQLIQQTIS